MHRSYVWRWSHLQLILVNVLIFRDISPIKEVAFNQECSRWCKVKPLHHRVPHGILFTFLLVSHKHSWFFWSCVHLNSLRWSFELKGHHTTPWIQACLLSPQVPKYTCHDACRSDLMPAGGGVCITCKKIILYVTCSLFVFFLAVFAEFYSSYLNLQFTNNFRVLFNSPGSLHWNLKTVVFHLGRLASPFT